MSGFFTAILRDGSLISGMLLLLAPILLTVGVAIGIFGLSGRYRSTRPCCRKCRFDLSGSMSLPATVATAATLPLLTPTAPQSELSSVGAVPAQRLGTAPEPTPDLVAVSPAFATRIGPELCSIFPSQCPECGVALARPGAILSGELRRRPVMIISGAVMIVIALTPTVWLGWRSLALVNWNHYRTVAALLESAESGETAAMRELQSRCAGGLKDPNLAAQALRILSKLLTTVAEIESTPSGSATAAASLAQLTAIDGLLTSLSSSGQISPQQFVELLPLVAPAADWKLASTTVHRSSVWINPQITAPPRSVGSMFGSKFYAQIKPTKVVAVNAEGREEEVSMMGSTGYFYPQNGGNATLNVRHRLKAGTYTIKADLRRTFTSLSPQHTDNFSVQGPLRVIGDSDITVVVRSDRETGQRIVDALKIHEIGIVTGYNNDKQVRLRFTAAGLPCDWSFMTVVQQGNRKYTLGPIAVPKENAGVMSVQSSTDMLFGSLKGFTDEPVNLILKPGGRKQPWNKTTVELWQGTITIPDLKVAKQRAYDDWPQPDTIPPTFFDRASVVVETETQSPPELPAESEK